MLIRPELLLRQDNRKRSEALTPSTSFPTVVVATAGQYVKTRYVEGRVDEQRQSQNLRAIKGIKFG